MALGIGWRREAERDPDTHSRSPDPSPYGEAEVAEPRMPSTVPEVEAMSWDELKVVFAISHAQAIRAFVDQGDEALRSEVERWEPDARATIARVLVEVA